MRGPTGVSQSGDIRSNGQRGRDQHGIVKFGVKEAASFERLQRIGVANWRLLGAQVSDSEALYSSESVQKSIFERLPMVLSFIECVHA